MAFAAQTGNDNNAHTLYIEKSPLMFILSIENLPGSVEGSGSMQITPKLENKAFSGKSTQYVQSKHHKETCDTALETSK
jgi:hypothetical protein